MDALEISNQALTGVGEPQVVSISNLDSNSPANATRCANLIQKAMNWVLSLHPWNCSKRRVILSPETTIPVFGFNYQFLPPADLIKLFIVGDNQGNIYRDGWEYEGGFILSMYNPLGIVYNRKLDKAEAGIMPEYLGQVVADYMSYRLCPLIAPDDKKVAQLYKLFENSLETAKTLNAKEGPQRTLASSAYPDARHMDSVAPWPIVR